MSFQDISLPGLLKWVKLKYSILMDGKSLRRLDGYIVPALEMFPCPPMVNFYFYRRLSHQAKNVQL